LIDKVTHFNYYIIMQTLQKAKKDNSRIARHADIVVPSDRYKRVDNFFDNLSLGLVKKEEAYWDELTIRDDAEYFARWVFGIMSVHTTWESNVRGYNEAMSDLSWTISKPRLEKMIIDAKVGINFRRNKGLWQLVQKFRSNPKQFHKKKDETWQECRNRLVGSIYGLGLAKTTYSIALGFPTEARLCCLDVHLLRFMGHDLKKGHASNQKVYEEMENEWLDRCDKYDVSPNVAREIYWNKVQNRRNSRYWSYCLER